MAIISGFNTVGTVPAAPATVDSASVATTEDVDSPLTTRQEVEKYFSDLPIMIDIARCESQFRQTDKDGDIIRGEKNHYDVGVMQINEKYHLEKAKELGMDIYTLDGNMDYARYLYEKEGARPWLSSSACWAHYQSIAMK